MRKSISSFFLFISLATSANAEMISPLDPTTSWANSFLMNSIFVAEYKAFMKNSQAEDEEKRELLKSEDAINLFVRAKFAILSSKDKKQTLQNAQEVEEFQMGHATFLTSYLEPSNKFKSFLFAQNLNDQTDTVVTETYKGSKFHQFWGYFQSGYKAESPSCPISADQIKSFGEHQKQLTSNGKAANAKSLVEPIKGWSLSQVRCLLLTMMAIEKTAKVEYGLDPIHLLNAMSQTNSIFAKDNTIKTIHAIRFLQKNNYAETLRILIRMQDSEEAYRLPYEMVQRIYSRNEKGQGKVALKGI